MLCQDPRRRQALRVLFVRPLLLHGDVLSRGSASWFDIECELVLVRQFFVDVEQAIRMLEMMGTLEKDAAKKHGLEEVVKMLRKEHNL